MNFFTITLSIPLPPPFFALFHHFSQALLYDCPKQLRRDSTVEPDRGQQSIPGVQVWGYAPRLINYNWKSDTQKADWMFVVLVKVFLSCLALDGYQQVMGSEIKKKKKKR